VHTISKSKHGANECMKHNKKIKSRFKTLTKKDLKASKSSVHVKSILSLAFELTIPHGIGLDYFS